MDSLPVCVLNPAGRDPDQDFSAGAGQPDAGGRPAHPPVNYHAYAACTRGMFLRSLPRALEATGPVILLARGDLRSTATALRSLKRAARPAWIAVKEAGRHQVAALLGDAGRLARFTALLREADGFLASTPWLVPFCRGLGANRATFLPTPYPVEVPAWRFDRALPERQGILVGTREFDVPSRNHLAALAAALAVGRETGVPVSVFCAGDRRDLALLRALEPDPTRLRVLPGPIPYADWLRCLAAHRIVFQMDRSGVPGQVAGDALLCGTPCVGGDGAVEQVAWPDSNGIGRDTVELQQISVSMLTGDAVWRDAVGAADAIARAGVSFGAVGAELQTLLVGGGGLPGRGAP